MFQKLGIIRAYYTDDIQLNKANYGRYNVTGKEKDKFVFKVPSLRNLVLTAPYLHDGSVSDLKAVIKLMGIYQLGKEIPNEDIVLIEAFLKSLTGKKYTSKGNKNNALTMSN